MDIQTIERLKNLPKTKCEVCNTSIIPSNPGERCEFCKKKYCFDHLYGMFVKKGQRDSESCHNICDKCLLVTEGHLLK